MSVAAPRLKPTVRVGAFLIALSATAPLSVDMFLPSMPDIADEFATSESVLTLGVTLFLVAFAGSQLFYGPASDRWGRRPILLIGLAIYGLGGLVCLTATSAEMLILGRVLQGLGGGAGPALANAMVLDLYGGEGAAKMIGYMSIALPLAPAIAPVIGGGLALVGSWRLVFVVLTGLAVAFVGWYLVTLGETRPPRAAVRPDLRANYKTLFGSPTFTGFAMVMGLMFSGQLLFISTSSFVLIDRLGMAPAAFGLAFGLTALGIMLGAAISSRLVGRVPGPKVVVIGAAVTAGSAAIMFTLALAGIEHPAMVVAPVFGSAAGMGLSRPQAMAGALVPFPHMAGLASSMLVFTQMTISSGYNVAYSSFVEPGVLALATGMLIPTSLALLAMLVLRPGRVAVIQDAEAAV